MCIRDSIEGVYVPAFYDVSYRSDGRVEAITAKEGAPAVVLSLIHIFFPAVWAI